MIKTSFPRLMLLALIFCFFAPSAFADPAPKVTVTNAGDAASRKLLRLNVAQGYTTTMEMTTTTTSEVELAGQKMPAPAQPPMTMKTSFLVESADAKKIVYVMKITDFQVPGGAMPFVEDFKRMEMRATITRSGIVEDFAMTLPPDADPLLKTVLESMKNSFTQVAIPFPDEPVGVGATWTFQHSIPLMGLTVEQGMSMKLEKIEGEVVTLSMDLSQGAKNQQMQMPGMPPGVKISLDNLKSTGKAKVTFDLNQLVPDSTVNIDSDMSMDMEMQGQKNSMRSKSQTNVVVKNVK